MRVLDGSVWLSQRDMAGLFDVRGRIVNEHLQSILEDAELHREATIRKFRMVQTDGNRSVNLIVEHFARPTPP